MFRLQLFNGEEMTTGSRSQIDPNSDNPCGTGGDLVVQPEGGNISHDGQQNDNAGSSGSTRIIPNLDAICMRQLG